MANRKRFVELAVSLLVVRITICSGQHSDLEDTCVTLSKALDSHAATGACATVSEQPDLADSANMIQKKLSVHGRSGEAPDREVAKATAQQNKASEHQQQSFCSVGNGWEHDWSDEFDGDSLDGASWQVITSAGGLGHVSTVAPLSTTACRSAQCRTDHVRVTGGALRILTARNATTGSFSSGAVTTKGHRAWGSQRPHRVCIKAQLPAGGGGPSAQGIWPAHWMLPDNGISEQCLDEGEVDIMEMINGDGKIYSTYHWMASPPEKKCADYGTYHRSTHGETHPSGWGASFHEYAVERSADQLVFAVDGRQVLRVKHDQLEGRALSRTPFFLILNTAVGGAWPGEPTEQTMGRTEHVIDYVRVVRRSEQHGK